MSSEVIQVNESPGHYLAEAANVPPGYKRSEVGVIPEEWEVKQLRSISPSQSVGLVINPSSYFDDDGTVPMLVGSNVGENVIHPEFASRISAESNAQISASRLSAGDLVTVRVGEPGVTAVVPPELDECNCASMMIVRKHRSFDSTWLCFVMNSRIGRCQVENVQYGTAQKQFNISDAICFVYPVPPLPEQRIIAEVLSDVDGLLGALEMLIAKKRAIKQAVMQQLLTGKTRLPGYSEEWKMKRVGEMGEIVTGGTPSTVINEFWGGDYPWITPTDIGSHRDMDVSERYLTKKGINTIRALPADTVLVTCIASIGKNAILKTKGGCNQQINAVIPNKLHSPLFLYYVFEASKEYLLANSGITATRIISKSVFRELAFTIPTHDEQRAIATVLSDMDNKIAALGRRLDKTRAIKQGMMQQLLTGRVRLVKSEEST